MTTEPNPAPISQMARKLKPCPFCGGAVQPRDALWPSDGNTDSVIHVEYATCGASDFSIGTADEGVSVAAAWNTRTQSTRIAELEEALRPFAKAAGVKLCGDWADDEHFGRTDVQFYLTFGDIRRASSVLSKGED